MLAKHCIFLPLFPMLFLVPFPFFRVISRVSVPARVVSEWFRSGIGQRYEWRNSFQRCSRRASRSISDRRQRDHRAGRSVPKHCQRPRCAAVSWHCRHWLDSNSVDNYVHADLGDRSLSREAEQLELEQLRQQDGGVAAIAPGRRCLGVQHQWRLDTLSW